MAEISPCHNLGWRSVPVFFGDPAVRIADILICGKDGWLGDRRVECWTAGQIVRIAKAAWPAGLDKDALCRAISGKRPTFAREYGYHVERVGDAWAVAGAAVTPAQPKRDFKADAAGDEEVPF